MSAHVDRLDNHVRQSVVVESGEATAISIAYFTATESIEIGRRMVAVGEELLREQAMSAYRAGRAFGDELTASTRRAAGG